MSSLSDLTLQNEIAVYIRKIYSRGLAVFAMEPTKIGEEYKDQEAFYYPQIKRENGDIEKQTKSMRGRVFDGILNPLDNF